MKHAYQKGQALVTLLIFVLIAVIITSGAIALVIINSMANTKFEQGNLAYFVAEAGTENAMLRLLRDTRYCGEVLPVGSGSATIVVQDTNNTCNGASPFTITSTGTLGTFIRTIQVTAQYDSNGLTITTWKEI